MKTCGKMRRIGVNEQVNISGGILDYINETRSLNIIEFTKQINDSHFALPELFQEI